MYFSKHYALKASMIAILISVTDTTERANHQIHRRMKQVEILLYWRCTPDNLLPLSQSQFVIVVVFSSREH